MPNDALSSMIPAPELPALRFRGEKISPDLIIRLWKQGSRARQKSRSRILQTRAFRRRDPSSLVKIDAKWARKFPQAASVARLTIEERTTLEANLIAAVGNVEPEYEREPLGFLDTDRDDAEACQAYLEEWRQRSVPTQTFVGKQTEDGEHALVTLPCDLDFEGSPDYFEYLSDAAYDKLDDKDKKTYSRDDDDRRKRYVKRDADGNRTPRSRYGNLLNEPDTDKQRPAKERQAKKEQREKQAEQAHKEDVAQYILRRQLDASAVRVIPALECAPIFSRGRRRGRWELVALVERTLYERYELLDAKDGYRWTEMGDRKLIAQACAVEEQDVGEGDRLYVYKAYVSSRDDDGKTHLLICTTIGGAGTWDTVSGNEHDPDSVSVIDLYDEYGVEGEAGGLWPFVTYHGGLHSEDDDPDHYWRPYLWALIDRLKAIESEQGAMRAVTALVAYTGHFHTPDPRWAQAEDGAEFLLDAAGVDLRKPRMPGAGEIETGVGAVTPAQQAQIGQDAWRLLEMDRMALADATAIDQIPGGSGPSGHALLVQSTLGQVSKRQIREGVKGAVIACGEAHLRILHGIYEKFGICWPLRTVQERPVKGEERSGRALAMYDPDWVADGQFNLAASYPEEENLARIDLEMNLAMKGFGSYDDVQAARAKKHADTERLKADRDRLLKHPMVDAVRMQRIARKMGDRELQEIADLQAEQLMSQVGGVPGVEGGIPNDALKRRTEAGMQRGGGGNVASSVRGGVQGAQMTGASMQADAEAALGGTAA